MLKHSMKRDSSRLLALILALAMILSLMGCGGGNAPAETEAEPAENAAGESQASDEAPEEGRESAEATAEEGTPAEETKVLNAPFAMPTGGLVPVVKPSQAEKVGADEAAMMDRAMRDFTPQGDTLVINDAEEFYYYSQLDENGQYIYDTMLLVCLHPDQEDNYNILFTDIDPASQEFYDQMVTAYFALIYDHPELFWLYNSCETDIGYAYSGEESALGYSVYFYLDHPVEHFEEQQTAFNEAAHAFLSEIDTSAGEAEIAEQIHDKLIEQVTYNMPVLDNSSAEAQNLAHTAYGALVADSYGNANDAVCDGYSLAYVYLLQQCGIRAAFIGGKAGDSEATAGGHAWSMAQIDGKWHEVDVTWDDMGTLEDQLTPDLEGYAYYAEALGDPEYRDKLEHYLYMVSTEQITHYEPDEGEYTYITKDGMYGLMLVGSSVHIRDQVSEAGPMGAVMEMAPVAEQG